MAKAAKKDSKPSKAKEEVAVQPAPQAAPGAKKVEGLAGSLGGKLDCVK